MPLSPTGQRLKRRRKEMLDLALAYSRSVTRTGVPAGEKLQAIRDAEAALEYGALAYAHAVLESQLEAQIKTRGEF